MAQTYSRLIYHIVFSTKHRRPAIAGEWRPRLYEYVGGIIRNHKGMLHKIGGTDDHVHLLVRWRTDKDVAALVRTIKSNASKWVHDTFPGQREFWWQGGYGAFSVSHSQMGRVHAYIERQEAHHERLSFKEEFVALLKAHDIEYDERYIWD